ncbi:hypothetical protein Hdeb2414_s0050g00750681 [Helianthus debilis subsp. tardiflorus]
MQQQQHNKNQNQNHSYLRRQLPFTSMKPPPFGDYHRFSSTAAANRESEGVVVKSLMCGFSAVLDFVAVLNLILIYFKNCDRQN